MKKIRKSLLALLLVSIPIMGFSSCQHASNTILIGEGDWQSNKFYNAVAKFIIEEGYDREVETRIVDTPLLIQSLRDGGIDVNLEMWTGNIASYEEDISTGKYKEVGINFNDNNQGLYIPSYLATEYQIEYITDLVAHKELFPDPEMTNWNPEFDKAVVFGGTVGWAATTFFTAKFNNTAVYPTLAANFEFRPIDSSASLDATLKNAYEANEPWVGYNFEPTSIMGLYDMVLLKDAEEFNLATGTGNLPTSPVAINVSNDFYDSEPKLVTFFSKFSTTAQVASDALAYMNTYEKSFEDTAKWWLKENVTMWSTWVDTTAKNKVLEKLGL